MNVFSRFVKLEAASGIILVLCTIAAMICANSPLEHLYFGMWETTIDLSFGSVDLRKSLHHWINDGLMVLFFVTVGLEIKREILEGALSSLRKAAFPVAGALGGMIVPALIYAAFNSGTQASHGWGIPMATDIAFSLGILSLLGKRVPVTIRIFLAALAIADDMGAVFVIALFYTAELHGAALIAAALLFGVLVCINRSGVTLLLPYLVLGVLLWYAVLHSGVHATIAGVLLAATIPGDGGNSLMRRIEYALLPWVTFGIMPIFAFSNAGVALNSSRSIGHPIAMGCLLGLFLGKPIGITLFTFCSERLRLASRPEGVTWRHIHGVATLGGIGFTMSLFVANLSFVDLASLDVAKVGVLSGSLASAIFGTFLLWRPR